MKTFLGYASIALAVLGLAAYMLKPALRTEPWYKMLASFVVMLAIGIGLIFIDAAEKDVKTASAPVKNAMESRADHSGDKELLARVIHDWKDAFGRRDAYVQMWTNLWTANLEKRELDAGRFSMLEALVSNHKEQCDRFATLQSDLQKMGSRGARQNAEAAIALSIARCNDVRKAMVMTTGAISPDVLRASGGTVGHNASVATKLYQNQLSESKEREAQVTPLFTSALTALGMNPDLQSY